MLNKLIEWRKRIFMPDIISIPNKEWLQALGEETRNSVMIEGIFVDENELKETIRQVMNLASEVANYFRTLRNNYLQILVQIGIYARQVRNLHV